METSESDTVAITVVTKRSLYAVGAGLTIALKIPATASPRSAHPAPAAPAPAPPTAGTTNGVRR